MFPMFVKLAGRPVLVVGAGAVGEEKIRSLLDTGARVRVVALRASESVRRWAQEGCIGLRERAFRPADLKGMFLVIAATSSRPVNEFIFAEAQRRGILCNVVDVPELCDFFYPAVVRRGALQIAVSTSGQSPALAQRIRRELEGQFGPDYAAWVAELGNIRSQVLGGSLPLEQKRELLRSLANQKGYSSPGSASVAKGEQE